jgi:hypothetical protein
VSFFFVPLAPARNRLLEHILLYHVCRLISIGEAIRVELASGEDSGPIPTPEYPDSVTGWGWTCRGSVLALWSSGQSSWLQTQSSGFDSRHYQIFWEAVGLERGPLSLVNTTEELLGRRSSGSGIEIREYGRGDPLRWRRYTLYQQTLALTSPTVGGRSVGIIRSRTQERFGQLRNPITSQKVEP